MADIRIKDLAVTASSSASDDYLAVDGSTNGTRKLSAYSPTFGGNLTVSGGSIVNGAGTSVYYFGTPSANYMYYDGSSLYTRVGGSDRLTISGSTGNVLINTLTDVGAKVYSKVADGTLSFGAAGTTKGIRFAHTSTYSSIDGVDSSLSGSYQALQINGSTVQIATSGGTVAASFDSSQNATFAGTVTAVGISTFKRSDNTGSIRVVPTSGVSAGSDLESFNLSTVAYGRLNTRSTHLQVYTGTNATTLALTVDDSQRTILGGALRLNNAYTAGAPAATGYVTIQDSAGNTYKVLVGT